MGAWQLLHTAIEQHEIVQQLDEALLVANLQQILVELEATVVLLIFLPLEEIVFGGANRAVLKAF
jgi:hypothetical protein